MFHIIKNYPRFDQALLDAYANESSATVHEAMGRRGAMNHTIKPIAKGMKIVGRALIWGASRRRDRSARCWRRSA